MMNQQQARELLHVIEMSAIKTRSILMEAAGAKENDASYEAAKEVLVTIEPWLFSDDPTKPNLLKYIDLAQKKKVIEVGDIANICFVTSQILALSFEVEAIWQTPIPSMMEVYSQWEYEPL